MPSSTSNSAPSGLETPCGCRYIEVAEMRSWVDPSGKSIFALGVIVQGPPEEPVDDHHEQAHGADAEDDAVEISRGRGFGDIRPESTRLHPGVAPGREF